MYSSDIVYNKIDYIDGNDEVKATLCIEIGAEKKEQVFRFNFGKHNIEISNK